MGKEKMNQFFHDPSEDHPHVQMGKEKMNQFFHDPSEDHPRRRVRNANNISAGNIFCPKFVLHFNIFLSHFF
jgi:predicted SnoaL-like aldol condensation-catalyzing enzyme